MKSQILDLEAKACFDFFWHEANTDKLSPGYGLIRDRAPRDSHISSIASVGFGLTALVIGIERGWITRAQGLERAACTLDTLLNNVEQVHGFFYHFINMGSGKRINKSEVSVIDTAIALCGAITVGEYFGGEVYERSQSLYSLIDWQWFRDKANNRFYMGYTPERGFSGWWDFYAEQLMLYVLGAGAPSFAVPGDMFYSYIRHQHENAEDMEYIHSWFGSLFTHQFSHAWIDFRDKLDKCNIDWWDNSVKGTLANREYCIQMGKYFKTFHGNSWGLTPCDGPWGYQGRYGAAPSAYMDNEHRTDGTVPPAGAAGSIVFTPDESIEALKYYYDNHPKLWCKYGFKDAYNLDVGQDWYASGVIGIDKGITLLMIENYRSGLVWDLFMRNKYVKEGISRVGLRSIGVKTNIA